MKNKKFSFANFENKWYVWPKELGKLDLQNILHRNHPDVLVCNDANEVDTLIERMNNSINIQYIGWLPVFKQFGDCGNHPQFTHIRYSPEGYYFSTGMPLLKKDKFSLNSKNIDDLFNSLVKQNEIKHSNRENPLILCRDFLNTNMAIIWVKQHFILMSSKNLEYLENSDKGCSLILDNYRQTKYNIVRCVGYFWAISQKEGKVDFNWFLLKSNRFPIYYSITLIGLLQQLDKQLNHNVSLKNAKKNIIQIFKEQQFFSNLSELLNTVFENIPMYKYHSSCNSEVIIFNNICGSGYDIVKLGDAYHAKVKKEKIFSHITSNFSHTNKYYYSLKMLMYSIIFFPTLFMFIFRSLRNGATIKTIWKFIKTRDLYSQTGVKRRHKLVFIPSIPYFLGQLPWVIEIEDFVAFCLPFLHNGETKNIQISSSKYFPCLLALLQSRNCKAIITHIKSTAENMPKAFKMPELTKKVFYIPLGIHIPVLSPKRESYQIKILFSSSWHQQAVGFYLRGGLDVLCAFDKIAARYPRAHLIIRSALPSGIATAIFNSIKKKYPNQISLINDYLPKEQHHQIMSQADISLLPAARIHVVSILEAMGYGHTLVTSDGWGITEYVKDGVTGVIIKGRYGVTSWSNQETGMLHEDYKTMYTPNKHVINQLIKKISQLIVDPNLMRNLGNAARQAVIDKFNIQQWNEGLKKCFDTL